MEELFRYYLSNIIILRIGTGLRYLWLRFVRHRKILTQPFMKVVNRKKQQNYLILKMKCQIGHGDVALFFFCDILNYIFTQIFIINIQKK